MREQGGVRNPKRTAWSASALKASSGCELAFALRYTRPRVEEVQSSPAAVGDAIHAAIEEVLRSGASVEDVLHARQASLTSVDTRRLLGHVEQVARTVATLRRWMEIYGVPREELLLEQSLQAAWEDEPRWLVGKIDMAFRIRRDGAPAMLVVDHKTGRNEGFLPHELQMLVYAELVFQSYPDIQAVCPVVHYTRDGELVRGDVIPAAQRLELRDHLRGLTQAAGAILAKPRWTPTRSAQCRVCPYKPECPIHTSPRGGMR